MHPAGEEQAAGVHDGDSGQVDSDQGQPGAGDLVPGADQVFEAEEGQAEGLS